MLKWLSLVLNNFNVLTKYVTFLITEVYIYLNCAPGRFTGIEENTTGIFL